MKLRIIMENIGGELEARTVEAGSEENAGLRAGNVLISMVQQAGYLRAGDRFRVEEVQD
jgi:hypothetical protein